MTTTVISTTSKEAPNFGYAVPAYYLYDDFCSPKCEFSSQFLFTPRPKVDSCNKYSSLLRAYIAENRFKGIVLSLKASNCRISVRQWIRRKRYGYLRTFDDEKARLQ